MRRNAIFVLSKFHIVKLKYETIRDYTMSRKSIWTPEECNGDILAIIHNAFNISFKNTRNMLVRNKDENSYNFEISIFCDFIAVFPTH